MKIFNTVFSLALLLSTGAYALDSTPEEMAETARDLKNSDRSSYDIIISSGVAAIYWKKSGSSAYYYDDDIAKIQQIAKQLNKKTIQVSNATADTILVKAGLQEAVDPKKAREFRENEERFESGQMKAPLEPLFPVTRIGASGPLRHELNCLAALGGSGLNDENIWTFSGTHSGQHGFYLANATGLHFYPLNPHGDFKSCVNATHQYPYDYYDFKVALPGSKPFFLTYSEALDHKDIGLSTGSTPPEVHGGICTIQNREAIDEDSKSQLNHRLTVLISSQKTAYDRQLSYSKITGRFRRLTPNTKNYMNRLSECEGVSDPAVRQALQAEEAKFPDAANSDHTAAPATASKE